MENNETLSERRKMLIFTNLIITCVAASILVTALSTALPPMIAELNVPYTTGQWITSGFSLVQALMLPLSAFLITRFPTKKLYSTALLLMIAGLFISAISTTFELMMSGRVLQAIGSATQNAMTQVIILTIFSYEKRGTVMGWFGLASLAAPIIAPSLTGILVDFFGWRMVFWVVLAIMLISFVWAIIFFEDVLPTSRQKFDQTSFVMSIFAFGGITLGIGNLGVYPFVSWQVGLMLAVGFVFGGLFVHRQLTIAEPLLNLTVLKDKVFVLGTVASMILNIIMMGGFAVIPVYVQQVLGQGAAMTGFLMLPGSLIMALITPYAGKFYDKFGIKKLFIIGSVICIIGNLGMVIADVNTPIAVAAFWNFVRNIAFGLLMTPLLTWSMSKVQGVQVAHATAVGSTLKTISNSIGAAVFVTIVIKGGETALAASTRGSMVGVNLAFLVLAACSALLLLIAMFGCKTESAE